MPTTSCRPGRRRSSWCRTVYREDGNDILIVTDDPGAVDVADGGDGDGDICRTDPEDDEIDCES